MAEKVEIENVNIPGSTSRVDAAKYQAMRDAVLSVLPSTAPGLTIAEIRERIGPHLPQELYPGGAKAGWWLKAVQLDLEAKGSIERSKTSPIRLHRR